MPGQFCQVVLGNSCFTSVWKRRDILLHDSWSSFCCMSVGEKKNPIRLAKDIANLTVHNLLSSEILKKTCILKCYFKKSHQKTQTKMNTKSSPKTLNTKPKNFGIWTSTEISMNVDSLTFSIILLNTSGRNFRWTSCCL